MSELISVKNAPHFLWGETCSGWWLKQNGLFTVISEMMPQGTSEKRHFHAYTEQLFYCIDGVLSIEVYGREHILHVGDSLTIQPGAPHRAFNSSNANTHFLVISCPNSHEDRVDLVE